MPVAKFEIKCKCQVCGEEFMAKSQSRGTAIKEQNNEESKMRGHTNVRTTQIYAKVVDLKKENAKKRITLDLPLTDTNQTTEQT